MDKVITGTTEEEMKKFAYFVKNKDKYPKVQLVKLPLVTTDEDEKFSASTLRSDTDFLEGGSWLPDISESDKQKILDILVPKAESLSSFKKFFRRVL